MWQCDITLCTDVTYNTHYMNLVYKSRFDRMFISPWLIPGWSEYNTLIMRWHYIQPPFPICILEDIINYIYCGQRSKLLEPRNNSSKVRWVIISFPFWSNIHVTNYWRMFIVFLIITASKIHSLFGTTIYFINKFVYNAEHSNIVHVSFLTSYQINIITSTNKISHFFWGSQCKK